VNKIVLMNVLMNCIFMVLFIVLNNWALQNGLEETFISLAFMYGVVAVGANGFYVARFGRR